MSVHTQMNDKAANFFCQLSSNDLPPLLLQIAQSFIKGRDFLPLWTGSILVSSIMILTRCMTGDQARQSLDW